MQLMRYFYRYNQSGNSNNIFEMIPSPNQSVMIFQILTAYSRFTKKDQENI